MSVLDSIFNYHERLVVDEMSKQLKKHTFSEAQLSDIACLALNKVPAKYIKHSVDRAFYTSDVERMEIAEKIEKAVAEAIAYIASAKH